MSNKTYPILKNYLNGKFEFILIVGLVTILLTAGLTFPKSIAKGDVTQDNTAGSWVGNLGPAAVGTASSDVDAMSSQISINYNSVLSQYEATQNANGSGYFIRSKNISPPVGTMKKWKQLKLGFRRPTGTNTTISVDILCGDQAQCPTLDQPIPGYSNITLSASDDYDIPSSLTVTNIKIRVNFSSVDVTQPQTALYNWQVSWVVNSGVNLTVTKTPNPANPELQGGSYAGVANNNQVVYTLNYTLDTAVSGLTIQLPLPAGTYTPIVGTPKTYTAAYLGSSGGSLLGNTVVWNLGDNPAGTVGSVSATFKIQTGPPDGMIFKTKASIYGSNYSIVTLPDDQLNIQSRAFAQGYVVAPQYIGKSTEVGYVLRMVTRYYYFQSDMYNARYEFVYPSCLDNTNTNYPKVYGSGISSWSVDRPNRKITFNLPSPITGMSNFDYSVTLLANNSCGTATTPGTFTFFSDQDATFVAQKVSNVTYDGTNPSNWDSTLTPHVNIIKNGGPNPSGAGQQVSYALRFDQQSTVAATNFYAIDAIPTQTTFINANLNTNMMIRTYTGGIANTWKMYWCDSTCANPPTQTDTHWQLLAGTLPCASGCTVPAGQEGNVKWIKWEVGSTNSFIWDRQENFDQPIGNLNVVTSTSASGTITNTVTVYAGNVCTTGCSSSFPITINNQPYFDMGYDMSNNTSCASAPGGTAGAIVQSGSTYCTVAWIANSWAGGGTSHGDATNVVFTMRLPDKNTTNQFLDPSYDPSTLPTTEVFARCVTNAGLSSTCPDASGTLQTNPSWLQPSSVACSTTCSVTWIIPIIYSRMKYPQTLPWQYNFYVQVKTKLGLLDQQKICLGTCYITSITTTPANGNTNLPFVSPYEVTITSIVILSIDKTENQNILSCDPTNSVTYTLTYQHNGSTGGVNNLYVMDALPEVTSITPTGRLVYSGQSNANAPNTNVYFLTNYSRSGNPPSSDTSAAGPGWQPIANVSGQETSVDWVMWKKTATYNLGPAENVQLTLKDQPGCSPNGTVYTNHGFVSYDSNASSPASKTVLLTISNPGFITTNGGDIGSASGGNPFEINFPKSGGNKAVLDNTAPPVAGGGANSYSWNQTISSNSSRLLLVGVSIRGGGPPYPIVSTIKDNTSNQLLSTANAVSYTGGVRTEFWYLLNPLPGINNLTVTFSGSVPWGSVVGSSSWYNVNQTTPISSRNTYNANGYGNIQTVNIANPVTDPVIDVVALPNTSTDVISPGTGQTQLWNLYSTGDTKGAGSVKSGVANATMSWNLKTQAGVDKSEYWAMSAVSIQGSGDPVTTVNYLGIANSINTCCFQSAKNWLISSYFGLPNPFDASSSKIYPNYDKMFADYGSQAKACNNDSGATGCLNPDSDQVKLYRLSDNLGKPLVINTVTNYSGIPRIIFVDAGSSGGEALDINTNFAIGSSSAVIFVVKGDVKVDYGVTSISGVFLVDGQFDTGRRVAPNSGVAGAGSFATIRIGRDGFARIAYLSGDNIRFIKCNDLVCNNKNYGYVIPAQSNEVTELNMVLYEDSDGKDYPKIVVGMKDASGNATTKFISCTAENCLDTDPIVVTYPDVRDPDIIINGYPSYSFGSGSGSVKSVSIVNCPDKICATPPNPNPIDGGSSVPADKGNEVGYSIDTTQSESVATYVDRTSGAGDLWFAKDRRVSGGTGCSAITTWDCKKLTSGVDPYPGSVTHPTNGQTFIGYVDSTSKVIKYIGCSDKACSTTLGQTVDCTGGTACLGQPYVSAETTGSYMYLVYNVKNTSTSGYEVKLSYCNNTWSNCGTTAWTSSSISNNPSNPSGGYVAIGPANSWTQAIALGRSTEIGYPRIVFADQAKNLIYAHCKTATCSDIDYRVLDQGSPISLPDKTLNINGSIAAFGQNVTVPTAGKALNLERDLFQSSTTQAGEVLNFEPKYYYLFNGIFKYTETTRELPP